MNDANTMGQHQKEVAELKAGISEQYYSAIGRFVAEFSALEFLLKWIIGDAVKLSDDDATAIVSHDFAMLCTIAQSVLSRKKMEQTRRIQFNNLIKKCHELNDRRVRIVHGLWLIEREQGELLHASRQKLEAQSYYELSAGEVAAEADLASQLFSELQPFWEPLS